MTWNIQPQYSDSTFNRYYADSFFLLGPERTCYKVKRKSRELVECSDQRGQTIYVHPSVFNTGEFIWGVEETLFESCTTVRSSESGLYVGGVLKRPSIIGWQWGLNSHCKFGPGNCSINYKIAHQLLYPSLVFDVDSALSLNVRGSVAVSKDFVLSTEVDDEFWGEISYRGELPLIKISRETFSGPLQHPDFLKSLKNQGLGRYITSEGG